MTNALRYEYLDASDPPSWQIIKDDEHLRELAGFEKEKETGKLTASGHLSSEPSLPKGRTGQTRKEKRKDQKRKLDERELDKLTIA